MEKNLSYFMRETKEEIIKIPAPESFKDEKGNRIDMEVKLLSSEKIREIQNKYKERRVAYDKKGNPYIANGEIVFESKNDSAKALRHILVEALVYPDLKSKEFQNFYKCYDITEMPYKVFSDQNEFDYVFRSVMTALGILEKNADEDEKELDEAKN